MERQLVVWCPRLLEQQEHGREARALGRVLAAVGEFSPSVTELGPGVCAVPTRGPSRYFGGDETLARLIERALTEVEDVEDDAGVTARGVVAGIGVADGLFAACLAARSSLSHPTRDPLIVVPGGAPDFLSPWPVDVLGRPELADLLHRLGIHTLGAFAALPASHVLARFGVDGATCRAVAAGVEGELSSLHFPSGPTAQGFARAGEASSSQRTPPRQAGFFGGAAGAEARAAEAVRAVQQLLHPEAVVRARLQGGRGPAERARLVPWGEKGAGYEGAQTRGTFPRKRPGTKSAGEDTPRSPTPPWNSQTSTDSPWPGRVPAPSPAVVLRRALPAQLHDTSGRPIGVTGAGIASAAPARLSIDKGPWSEVASWAGPWPSDERWWSKRGRSRQARMQVVTATGAAYLLARRRGWWVEGIYD